jgi:hypothetical protein
MEGTARAVDRSPEEDVILALVVVEVPGRGYCWKLLTADGETVDASPIFPSLPQCLTDARHSAVLNPGTDPYLRR